MARTDPHSYADDSQPRTKHLRWKARIDFEAHVVHGDAVLLLEKEGSGTFDLDTKGLTIHSVEAGGKAVPFQHEPEEPILGQRLRIQLPANTREVRVRYQTSPEAIALQWLSPEQTEGKKHPYLFSQCQAIHARTMIPVQDSPVNRITYTSTVEVPEALTAVMSAGPVGSRDGETPGLRTFLFEMPQPIPPYLMALAVGELASRELGLRARVWAEPATVDRAAWEFAEIEKMIQSAEKLFGPYEWDRYDMLVLPPSFPYGGMENPRMTFLTPTLLAGDRSQVSVVAHELAHSWTGNLVTNANMEHFWLNEGFTVWAERRIHEAVWGEASTMLQWAIGQKDLESSLERFGPGSPLTCLRMKLEGIEPDDAFSNIPYEKGSRFLALIERTAGRETFDRFVREYMARYRFTSITTEQFLSFLEEKLPGVAEKVLSQKWLYEPGMPENAPVFRSAKVDLLTNLGQGWDYGERPKPEQIEKWNSTEMLLYLQNLPRPLDIPSCGWLDKTLGLTNRGNYEILVEWLVIAAASDYQPAFPKIREVLHRVGRMKYLRPLFTALAKNPNTRAFAKEVFEEVAPSYHAISRRLVQTVLDKATEAK